MRSSFTALVLTASCGVCSAPFARAQVLTEWQTRTLTVSGTNTSAMDVAVGSAGEVYVVVDDGYMLPFGGSVSRATVMRFDQNGAISWARDASRNWFIARGAIEVGDGFVFSAGAEFSTGVLRKYASNGALVWEVTQPVAFTMLILNSDPIALADGGVLITTLSSDFGAQAEYVLYRYSANGTLLWSAPLLSGSFVDGLGARAVAENGDVLVTGFVAGNAVVSRRDANGALLWSDAFTIGSMPYTLGTCGVLHHSDISISGGLDRASSPPTSYALVAHDAAGNRLWTREVRLGVSFAVTRDDNIVVVSSEDAGATGKDVFLTRLDAAGNISVPVQWIRSGDQIVQNIVAGDAGEVIIAGNDDVTGFVAMFDAQSQLVWSVNTTPPSQSIDSSRFLSRSTNGYLAIGGTATSSTFSNSRAMVVKFDATQSPDGYCTAKTNSQGCEPTLVFSGLSSAASTSGFTLSVVGSLNQVNGLYFYGLNGASSTPFQGGTMCVALPRQRTPLVSSGGSPGPTVDCSGVLSFDVNAFASGAFGGAANPQLSVPGVRAQWQCWSRDSNASFGTNLSNALSYVVLP